MSIRHCELCDLDWLTEDWPDVAGCPKCAMGRNRNEERVVALRDAHGEARRLRAVELAAQVCAATGKAPAAFVLLAEKIAEFIASEVGEDGED